MKATFNGDEVFALEAAIAFIAEFYPGHHIDGIELGEGVDKEGHFALTVAHYHPNPDSSEGRKREENLLVSPDGYIIWGDQKASLCKTPNDVLILQRPWESVAT